MIWRSLGIVTVGVSLWAIAPIVTRSQDTNPLCYFTDASGNRRDLSAWCGRPGAVPNATPAQSTSPNTFEAADSAGPIGAGTVELVSCQVERDRNTAQSNNSQRQIIHVTGSVHNQTDKSITGVTIRYVVWSQGSILDRRGQVLNEPTLAPNARGEFTRQDQPIAIADVTGADNSWRVEVEGIEWMADGKAQVHMLATPQRCI